MFSPSASGYARFANQVFGSSAIDCATAGPSFITTATAARDSRFPGAAQKRWSTLQPTVLHRGLACATLRQRDALKGADDIVGAFFGKETFVIAWAEVPVWTFVIIVAIKPPDTAYHDQTTDAVVPKIADVMETQVGSGIGAFKSNVIVKHNFRQAS